MRQCGEVGKEKSMKFKAKHGKTSKSTRTKKCQFIEKLFAQIWFMCFSLLCTKSFSLLHPFTEQLAYPFVHAAQKTQRISALTIFSIYCLPNVAILFRRNLFLINPLTFEWTCNWMSIQQKAHVFVMEIFILIPKYAGCICNTKITLKKKTIVESRMDLLALISPSDMFYRGNMFHRLNELNSKVYLKIVKRSISGECSVGD